MSRIRLVSLVAFAGAVCVRLAAAAPGDVVWSHTVPHTSYLAAATDGKLVYATGEIINPTNGTADIVVDAYNPVSGSLVWRYEYDAGGDEAAGVALGMPYFASDLLVHDIIKIDGDRVVVGGRKCPPNPPLAGVCQPVQFDSGAGDPIVLVFDKHTGALLFERDWSAGEFDGLLALDASAGRFYAVSDTEVRAYSDVSGALLWTHDVGPFDGPLAAVKVARKRVFLGNCVSSLLRIQGLDAANGNVVWTNDDPFSAEECSTTFAFATDRGRLYSLGGSTLDDHDDFVHLRTLLQQQGTLDWDWPGGGTPVLGDGEAVLYSSGRVFSAGEAQVARGSFGPVKFFVQANDASSGNVLWSDAVAIGETSAAVSLALVRTTATARLPLGDAVVPVKRVIAAAGSGENDVRQHVGLVRAYDEKTGAFAWQHQLETGGHDDDFYAIVAARGRLVVVGTSTGDFPSGERDGTGLIEAITP